MKKTLVFILSLGLAATITTQSQTTKEQADEIVISYLKNEQIDFLILYFNINMPNDIGIELITTKDEAVKIKYACWVYFVYEPSRDGCRYLFVKEDNGNLLEITTYGDTGPRDLSEWTQVNVGIDDLEYNLFPYPNPVIDWITIPVLGNKMLVEIYDLAGNKILSKSLLEEDAGRLNISFLKPGTYVLSVLIETKTFNFRIIKK